MLRKLPEKELLEAVFTVPSEDLYRSSPLFVSMQAEGPLRGIVDARA